MAFKLPVSSFLLEYVSKKLYTRFIFDSHVRIAGGLLFRPIRGRNGLKSLIRNRPAVMPGDSLGDRG